MRGKLRLRGSSPYCQPIKRSLCLLHPFHSLCLLRGRILEPLHLFLRPLCLPLLHHPVPLFQLRPQHRQPNHVLPSSPPQSQTCLLGAPNDPQKVSPHNAMDILELALPDTLPKKTKPSRTPSAPTSRPSSQA